jgi:hypothetical protein
MAVFNYVTLSEVANGKAIVEVSCVDVISGKKHAIDTEIGGTRMKLPGIF